MKPLFTVHAGEYVVARFVEHDQLLIITAYEAR